MSTLFILAISLHVLAAVFWAGTSFALARTGGLGGETLFGPQMGAAVVAVLTGTYIWHVTHGGAFDTAEKILAFGALCAIAAAGVQGAVAGRAIREWRDGRIQEAQARPSIAKAQRIAAGLLALTVVCMVASRYF